MKNEDFLYLGKLNGNSLQKFFQLLALEKSEIGLVYIYAVISGIVSLSLPLGIQTIMTLMQSAQQSSSWVLLISVVILSIIFSGALQIIQLSIIERLQQRIFTRTAFEFAYLIPRMKLEAMLKKYAPELMNRFFDVLTIQKGLPKILVSFFASMLQIFFGLVLLAFYHPVFVFYGLIVFSLVLVIFYYTSPKGLKTSIEESNAKYKVASWLQELAKSMNIFKLAGYTEMPILHTDKVVEKYITARQKHWKVLVNQFIYIITFKVLVTGGLLIIGSFLVFNKQINISQFVASEIIIILIINSIEKLLSSIETIYDVLTGIEKLNYVTHQELENEEGIPFDDIDLSTGMSIEFCNLNYQYPGTHHQALKNINLKIKHGEKVCVMGFGASGTSTFINLAASLLDEFEGAILFNGITVRNLNKVSLRSFVGENLSNNEIMYGTITENISMGRDDISVNDVITASKHVGLNDFVQALPQGYNTVISQNDITIPDSIMVKINLARSVAENPSLFVMDSPFLYLHKDDRVRISKFLTDRTKDWTLVVSTNDEAFASMCDRIIVLKNGEIVKEGQYEDLIKDPTYQPIFDR